MDDQLYEEKIRSNGEIYYVKIDIKNLLKGGAGELGFNNFYQKNKEYVKKWKEVLVKRQLFEMWHALSPEEQKEWLDKADALDKLFGLTDTTDVYKDIFEPKYPPTTELCKLLTKHASARAYFDVEIAKLKEFYNDHQEPGKPPPLILAYNHVAYNNNPLFHTWLKANEGNQTYTNKVLQEWKSSDNVSVRKSLRDAVCDAMTYSTIPKTTYEQIWSKTAKEWQSSYDAFEHAYDMFCENSKITNPQMRVTNADVKDHLSRMWTGMDIETQNIWNYSEDDTLPDTLSIRHKGVHGLDGDFEEENFDEEDLDEDLEQYLNKAGIL